MTPRQEKLKSFIEKSSILSDTERQDWLALLELMNDKQLSELESILNAPKADQPLAGAGISSGKPAFVVSPPSPLAHITNLPQNIALPSKAPAVKPSNKWMDGFKLTMEEKELPAPEMQPKSKPTPLRPPPPVATKIESITSPYRQQEDAAEWKPDRAQSASRLSIGALQKMGATHVIDALQQLVKKEGYVRVLEFLEQSPLYKAYLEAGNNMLRSTGPASLNAGPVSKEEFEQIADIFRKIQVNN